MTSWLGLDVEHIFRMLGDFLLGFSPSAREGAVVKIWHYIQLVIRIISGIRARGWTVAGSEMMDRLGNRLNALGVLLTGRWKPRLSQVPSLLCDLKRLINFHGPSRLMGNGRCSSNTDG